jgi:glycosyltransferase involved in cell wall biosynthesis
MVANYNRKVKRPDLFVIAAAEVVSQFSEVKFLLIGGGRFENELRTLISGLDLEGTVILGGKKESATAYIKSFDIGVLTSDSEGFSNVLLEYMAAGIPVVARDVGGNSEIIDPERTGLLISTGDQNGLANAIISLLTNRENCKEMGRNGREYVSDKFSWPRKIREVERYYEELIRYA